MSTNNNNRGPVEDAQHQQRVASANLTGERADQQRYAQAGVVAKNAVDECRGAADCSAIGSQAAANAHNNATERSQEIKREEGREAIPEKKNERV